MTNAEFREELEDRAARYAVEGFRYLRDLPYDVSTRQERKFNWCQLS